MHCVIPTRLLAQSVCTIAHRMYTTALRMCTIDHRMCTLVHRIHASCSTNKDASLCAPESTHTYSTVSPTHLLYSFSCEFSLRDYQSNSGPDLLFVISNCHEICSMANQYTWLMRFVAWPNCTRGLCFLP